MKKFLKCYPFALLNPAVKLIEGFEAYNGNLGDEPGAPHRGIDYARKDEKGRFISFDVFSAHDGEVFQEISKSWGRFVIITKTVGKYKFRTVYAHLRIVDKDVPLLPQKEKDEERKGLIIPEGRFLGKAGITGWTKRKVQLHFELLKKDLKSKNPKWEKLDPYGIYARAGSGKYLQPGHSLKNCNHFWTSDNPPFADEI